MNDVPRDAHSGARALPNTGEEGAGKIRSELELELDANVLGLSSNIFIRPLMPLEIRGSRLSALGGPS